MKEGKRRIQQAEEEGDEKMMGRTDDKQSNRVNEAGKTEKKQAE